MATNRVTGVSIETLTEGAGSNARVTGVSVEVLADVNSGVSESDLETAFTDDATLVATLSAIVELDASFIDEAVLSVTLTSVNTFKLISSFADASRLTALLDVHKQDHLKVSFADSARFNVSFLKVIKPTHLSADFSDGSSLSTTIFQEPADRGPFYAAWVDETDNVFNSSFIRNDEDVFSFEIDQVEGDFAQLTLVIKNPRIGLLAPSRNVWLWLSYYNGVVVKPLFFGRLIGVPSNIFATKVTLTFVAQPPDYVSQKRMLADAMRVSPYFDPIVVSPDSWDDPDIVLEARTELWHIDRVTGLVTTSDIVTPEDGIIELTEDDHLYDGLSISLNSVPLRRVVLTCPVQFNQYATGGISLTQRILNAWPQIDSPSTRHYESSMVSSYTFDGLSGDWPKPGARFGDGWTVVAGSLVDQSALVVPRQPLPLYLLHKLGWDPMSIGDTSNLPATVIGSLFYVYDWSVKTEGVSGFTITYVPIGWGVPELVIQYTASRQYTETIVIDMEADVQALKTMPGDDEILELNIPANVASDPTRDGSIPASDPRSAVFASTDRGLQLVQHLSLLARANLINRSRAIDIECRMKDFLRSFDVTLRKGLLIHDHRLPGHQAIGKIKRYNLSYSGGTPVAKVTIGSAVGYGGAVTVNDGEDAYIDDDYIEDYFVRDGNIVALPSSDVAYTVPNYKAIDDGLDFVRGLSAENVVRSLWVTGGPKEQASALDDYSVQSADMEGFGAILQAIPTQVHADVVPIGKGPYETTVPVIVSNLIVPKQIDLEAAT